MHNIQFRLLPAIAFFLLFPSIFFSPLSLFLSSPCNAFRLNPTPQPRGAFGDTQANSNFPQSDFFQSTPLEGLSYRDLVRAFLESIFFPISSLFPYR